MAEQVEATGPGRKFWLGIIYVVVLVAVLVFMVERLREKFDGVMFGLWLGAFTAGYITYVMGNAAVAGAVAKVTSTIVNTSSSSSTETKKDGA